MKAKFIGRDGSMGFLKNGIYEIETYIDSQFMSIDGWLWVKVKNSPLRCRYSSVESFLENWKIMKN